MYTRITCQTLLMMTLALGTIALGATMPQSINNDKDLKSALKAAKTPEDHARIAAYYQAKADRLEAQAAGYEQSAKAASDGPVVKNITAPNTAARYDWMAKQYREEAQNDRVLSASQRQMANGVEQASK